jgi:hypothetical protein
MMKPVERKSQADPAFDEWVVATWEKRHTSTGAAWGWYFQHCETEKKARMNYEKFDGAARLLHLKDD